MKTGRIQVRTTGLWYWYYAQRVFGQIRYSFDGENWYAKRADAYRAAEAAGRLEPAPAPQKDAA